MRTTSHCTILFGLFASLAGIQCTSAVDPYYFPEQGDLDHAISIWNAQSFGHYDFKYTKIDSNPENTVYPWLVTVQNGHVTAKDGNGNQILWTTPPDMAHLFSGIQAQLDANAKHIDVQYSDRGYPHSIYIIRQDGTVYDVRITDFHYYAQGGTPVATTTGGGSSYVQSRGDVLTQLAASQALWKSRAILNYSYQYNGLGANPLHIAFPWAVTVRNGHDASGKDGNGNVILWENPHPHTMEELFQRIHKAYDDNIPKITARYNPLYGYPEEIHIVYNEATPDADFHVQIDGFHLN